MSVVFGKKNCLFSRSGSHGLLSFCFVLGYSVSVVTVDVSLLVGTLGTSVSGSIVSLKSMVGCSLH